MKSDEAWRAGHAAALPKATMACLALLPPSLIVALFAHRIPRVVFVLEWLFFLAALVWIIYATRPAVRAARAVHHHA